MLKIKKLYYGISRFHVSEFMNSVKNELNTGFLLDAGAGDCPYRKLFLSHKYESCKKNRLKRKQNTHSIVIWKAYLALQVFMMSLFAIKF